MPSESPRPEPLPQKTFVLGVGCQKGGTTWLQAYLDGLPECDFGMLKEYHVLDVHYPPHLYYYRQRQETRLRFTMHRNTEFPPDDPYRDNDAMTMALRRVLFYYDIESYYDYFEALEALDDSVHVVGDITPSYALLSAEGLSDAKQALTKRDFAVKVIFLMRDPIERLYSAARMTLRDLEISDEKSESPELEIFEDLLDDELHFNRSNYEATIANLDEIFAVDDIYYGFYEDLFNDTAIKKITDFIGASFQPPDFGVRINASDRTSDLPVDMIGKAREKFAPVYDFVGQRFPDVDLPTLWEHA